MVGQAVAGRASLRAQQEVVYGAQSGRGFLAGQIGEVDGVGWIIRPLKEELVSEQSRKE